MKKYILILLVFFSAMWVGSEADAAIIVGRISYFEGHIYRYMDVDDTWVETSQQSPAGIQDILLTGENGRAEITFPNDLMVRMAEETEMEILNLDDDIGEFILHSGLARFYNGSNAGELIVESGRGTLKVRPGSVIDMQADKKSVTVSAVRGEATFHTYDADEERVEAISGSTSLEFHGDSIIAGIGPIDWNWDRWCADREEVWTENRLVRSEHLPESMQEYAYIMEPYGRWQRVYYRGYYYWAWNPYSIAIGWSPYTSGYWYDWHGSPVWMDNNPWGWVTHHYGYWLDLQGVWMWTPYVHVSHVPGVTVIGLNITFGKRFRPHWHPGRVRWIGHKDYIGWLPLAPWETYYGYRKWGPGSVVVNRGGGLSINISLSNHRHIDNAVIIPKHRLYNRKFGDDNNYEKARIRNVNKTAILKDYKPVSIAGEVRHGKHAPEAGRVGNIENRSEKRRTARDVNERKFTASEKRENKKNRSVGVNRDRTEEKNTVKNGNNNRRRIETGNQAGTVDNAREKIKERDKRNGIVRALRQNQKENEAKREKTFSQSRSAERDKDRHQAVKVESNPKRDRAAGQYEVERNGKRYIRQANRTVPVAKNRSDEKNLPRLSQKAQNRESYRDAKGENNGNRQYRAREKVQEDERERQMKGNSNYNRERNVLSSKREHGSSSRRWEASSLNGRRFR